MLNLNKFCSLFIGLILSVVCALPLSARDINVRGTVTNIEGEPLFRVSIYNAGTNKLIGSTNEDGKYLVKIDSEGELLFTSLGYEECKACRPWGIDGRCRASSFGSGSRRSSRFCQENYRQCGSRTHRY